jgi:tRNA threonylcarbamoyladenosine biosynthesis protein TsaB
MLLAIDTSTRSVGLALFNGFQVIYEAVWSSRDFHTVELAPAIAAALKKSNHTIADLAVLGVATGPGSFTGLRIGLALAKGVALARKLPMVGIPTLDSLAVAQPISSMPMAAVLRAGRGRLAVGWYQAVNNTWQSGRPVEVLTPQELLKQIQNPTYLCGELTEEERALFSKNLPNIFLASTAHSLRRPSFLAELAWQRWKAGQQDDPATLAPIYLHYNDPVPG